MRKLKVGIIGVQPGRSWGAVAHIPALRALGDRFVVAGLANSSVDSSRRAAELSGVARAFDTPADLIACDDVDVVSICVKVPHHAAYALAAIAAGKHVVCEWPLAVNLAEAERLAGRAVQSGVTAIVGLQGVFAPAVEALARLRADGAFGTLFSSTIVGHGMTWGAEIEQRNAHLLDARNGATMLTIAVGHMLSAVEQVFGPVASVQAMLSSRRKSVRIRETGAAVPLNAPDQILLSATFADGMPLSLHYRGGPPTGVGLQWEVHGEDASARVEAPSGLIEMTGLTLDLDRHDGAGWQRLCAPAGNPVVDGVRELYAAAHAQITEGRRMGAPDFARALRLHRLLDAITRSARTGRVIEINHPA